MKRRVLLQLGIPLLILCALFLLLAYPADRTLRPQPLLEVSVILRETDASLWTNARQGMEQAAMDLDVELRFLTPAQNNDAAQQAERVCGSFFLGFDSELYRRADKVLHDGHIIEKIDVLEHHTHTATGFVDVDSVRGVNPAHCRGVLASLETTEQIVLFDLGDECVFKLFVGHVRARFQPQPAQTCKRRGFDYHVAMKIRIDRRYESAVQPHLAVSRFFEQVHAAQQRGLAAARRPYDNDLLAFFYRRGHRFQHFETAEILIDILNVYHLRAASLLLF